MIDWNEYFTLSNGKLYWKPGAVISRWGTPIRNKIARARYFDDFISACEQRIIWEVSFGFSENYGCDHVSKNTFCKPEEMP